MTKQKLGTLFLMISIISLISSAQVEEKSLSLTLENCILKTMKNNLGVAVEVLNPEIRDLSVSLAKEKFLPIFNLNFFTTDQEQESYSYLDASDVLKASYNQYGIGYQQFFPTGGSLAITLDSSKYDTNQTGDWEIFRLGELPDRPNADPNISRGVGPNVIDIAPSLSPDAEWIAFASTRDGNWEIYVAAVDGSFQQRVTINNEAIDIDPVDLS